MGAAKDKGKLRTPKASPEQPQAGLSESPLDLLARAGAVFSRGLGPEVLIQLESLRSNRHALVWHVMQICFCVEGQ